MIHALINKRATIWLETNLTNSQLLELEQITFGQKLDGSLADIIVT